MRPFRPAFRFVTVSLLTFIACATALHALQVRQEQSRFDRISIPDPSVVVSPAAIASDAAPMPSLIRTGWASFKTAHGKAWDVTVDGRSGAPLLVQGQGIPMIPGTGNTLHAAGAVTLDLLAAQLRSFVTTNASITLSGESELSLNREGSGALTQDLWKVVFDRSVAGVPVAGDRWIFYVGHGNLIAFGATRWSPIATSEVPFVSVESARAILFKYMGLTEADKPEMADLGSLLFVPMAAAGTEVDSYNGIVGAGYETALAWKFSLEVAGEAGKWTGLVDAHTGKVLALYDTIQYAQAKGGVQPLTNDAICPDGCEQPSFPMPFANITIGASSSTAGSMGAFTCAPGGSSAVTTLSGTYVRVADSCGAISQSVTCDADLDLKTSSGTDCTVPAGASAGDTHAARSSFYHLNRIKEHARAWMPANSWLTQQLTDNVNINQTCNAFWNDGGAAGTVNFYRSGGGCRNTGEIAAVFLHEWGHGLDQNDGGGYDNPSEAYGDVTSFLLTHKSCVGRGFTSSQCTGYGNACLNCTGVRDQDWDQHSTHQPQTPTNWPASCSSGSVPCGKEVHCEAYLSGEAVWDLAVRDLPASGVDAQTSWAIADRLWFKSRTGAGGNAYTCGTPASNRSCAANAWMTEFRTIDDDDGNLANGTPHAAAIFAAFNRHGIPCGAATDAANLNHTSCPALPAPTVTANGSANQIALSWTAVAGASSYNVLRNDQGCGWGFTLVANVAGTTYSDIDLPNVFPMYYAIQPVGSDTDCVGPLSACTAGLAGGPHAVYTSNARVADTCASGGAGNNDSIYDAGEQIQFSVTLRNDGSTTLTGVTATLTPTTPGVTMVNGTASFGTIAVLANGTSAAPHFTAQLPANLACGSTVSYNVAITANEGTWTGSFTQTIGLVTPGGGTALSESFSGGIPGTWTVVNGGTGTGTAATWTTANPGNRTFTSPLAAPVAMVDSDAAAATDQQDEQLITPVMNLSTATSVTLNYDEYFRWYNLSLDEKGDVDVMSSLTGGAWVNVVRNQGASNQGHRTVNITAQAAGASNVQVRFRYYNAVDEWWWEVDNVVVTYTAAGTCTTHTCIARPYLRVTKSSSLTAAAGQDIPYTVTVTNDGPGSAADVQLADEIPANTTFRSIAPPGGWSCQTPSVGGTGTITCTTPSLPVSAPAVFTIVLRANQCAGNGTVIENRALVSSPTADPNSQGIATATTTLTDTGACDDGNACTQTDSCQSGACVGSSSVTCAASDQCHDAGACNPATGVCSNPAKANGSACNDGNACTQTDTCQAGACAGSNPVTCTASDQCHDAGACDALTGQCSNPTKADGFACNDGNACTQTDTCQAGTCAGSNPVTCAASDQCHDAGACDASTGQCSNPAKADGFACNDGNACTQTDTCQAGACAGSNPVTCNATDQCHDAGACDALTGQCSNPAKADGSACTDGNACTQTDTCQSGACAGSNPVVCVASDQCHVAGACDPFFGTCSNPVAPDATACDDGNECTSDDACSAGQCGGTPVGAPSEVMHFDFTSKTVREWSALTLAGPAAVYDVARGALGQWPVGSGGSEQCQASGVTGTSIDVSDDPAANSGFWYLVRGRTACGTGTYGQASDGTPRVTTVCP